MALDRFKFSPDVYGGIVLYNRNIVIKEASFGDEGLYYGVMVKRGGYVT